MPGFRAAYRPIIIEVGGGNLPNFAAQIASLIGCLLSSLSVDRLVVRFKRLAFSTKLQVQNAAVVQCLKANIVGQPCRKNCRCTFSASFRRLLFCRLLLGGHTRFAFVRVF
jgi:hypothetical protein